MARTTRTAKGYALCIECGHRIDTEAVVAALKAGVEYRHSCGRILSQQA